MEYGSPQELEIINGKQPQRRIKQRVVRDEHGQETGYEEYYSYTFPDDSRKRGGNERLLANAREAKLRKLMQQNKNGDPVLTNTTLAVIFYRKIKIVCFLKIVHEF